ncbi:MAG: hypothetical protein KVP17_000803 [Porospora cf. gigantea B]|uniref:uncharacterized protein n=1 Tax=Porospora cf. gigantea B TaxID=2853592 RepID=UPI0035718DCC|nr:MAG: hypothetical protein KVP17_000803 [Porospora cf. gigantea B]
MKLLKEDGSVRIGLLGPLVASLRRLEWARSTDSTSPTWYDFQRGSQEEEPLCNFTATAYYREPSPVPFEFREYVPTTESTIVSPTTYHRIANEEVDMDFVIQSPPPARRQTVSAGYRVSGARPPPLDTLCNAAPPRPLAGPQQPIRYNGPSPPPAPSLPIAPPPAAPPLPTAPRQQSYRWVKPSSRAPQV